MAKMYTLDNKLLIGSPEIRIKDKVYPVDDREKTAKKIIAIFNDKTDETDAKKIEEVFKLAFSSKDYKEIDNMNLPWVAYQEVFKLVIAAVLGEEPETLGERFQEE